MMRSPETHPSQPGTSAVIVRQFRSAHMMVTDTIHRRGVVLPRHSHQRAGINFVLGGVYRERLDGKDLALGPVMLAFKPAGMEHANDFREHGARCVLIEVTPEHMEQLADAARVLHSPCVADNHEATHAAGLLYRELARDGGPMPLAVETLVHEIFATAATHRATVPRMTRGSRALAQTIEILHTQFREPPTLCELATAVQLHPSHLARVFRAVFACTIGDYVRRVRVSEAVRLLTATPRSIASIAAASGFADQSHATRCIRAALGLTSSDLRRLLADRNH